MVRKIKKRLLKKPKINFWLYWSPRILTILFILFISMFALDIFGNGYTFWETVIGLFMHLIPSIMLTIFLIIAWKWEWVGAVGFFLFTVWYVGFMALRVLTNPAEIWMMSYSLIIAGPAILIGILWWLNWVKKK